MKHILVVLGFLTLYFQKTFATDSECSDSSDGCECQPGWWGRNCEYPLECLISGDNGVHYRGTQNVTSDGVPCDPWDLPNPSGGSFSVPPDGTHHNYCRHIPTDNQPNTWCYTTQSSGRWGACSIPLCDTQCDPPIINKHVILLRKPQFGFEVTSRILFGCDTGYTLLCKPLECLIPGDNGVHYRGTQNVTSDGTPCEPWDLHGHSFDAPPDDPHHNYCRHIQENSTPNTWCYIATENAKNRSAACNISLCDTTVLFSANLCQKGYYDDKSITCTSTRKWSAPAPTCTDINECTTNINPCPSPNTFCFNTVGSLSCNCSHGYTRDANGYCVAICEPPILESNSRLLNNRSSYIYGDIIDIKCDEGFMIEGQTQFICLNDRSWNGIMPRCIAICNRPTIHPNSKIRQERPTYICNDTIEIECDTGYQIKGDTQFICQNDGSWSGIMPTCIDINECTTDSNPCPLPNTLCFNTVGSFYCNCSYGYTRDYLGNCVGTCQPPILKSNSRLLNNRSTYIYNDTIAIYCDEGFNIDGQTQFICQNDRHWNGIMPSCKAICNRPAIHPNSIIRKDRVSYICNDTIDIECDEGYQIKGDTHFICQDDRSWSGTMPTCMATCMPPILESNSRLSNNRSSYMCSDIIEIECDDGFKIEGQTEFMCLNDRRWNGIMPRCIAICNRPAIHPNSRIRQERPTYIYNDTIEVECDTGYQIKGTTQFICQNNRRWSGSMPSCIDVNECTVNTTLCPLPNTLCINTVGSFDCNCLHGYTRDTKENCVALKHDVPGTNAVLIGTTSVLAFCSVVITTILVLTCLRHRRKKEEMSAYTTLNKNTDENEVDQTQGESFHSNGRITSP